MKNVFQQYYDLETNGKTQTFSSQITIGPPLKGETPIEINISIPAIIVVLCVILVIGYIILTQIRHRRR